MRIPLQKLKAIILYFGTNTDSRFLGKVKLMKLFYFLDFMHIKKHGVPVTYDYYVNLEHGPIPSSIKNLIDSAADDPDNSLLSDIVKFERPEGTNMYRIVPTRSFTERDEKYFSKNELDILQKICIRFGDRNTKYIEDASHDEAPWKETNILDNIPYTLAAKDRDCLVSEEDIKLLTQI